VNFLDNDFYNFTMGQFIWSVFGDVEVEYEFLNRSNIPLAPYMHSIEDRLDVLIENMIPYGDQIEYLSSLDLFSEEYLEWLYMSWEPVRPIIEVGADRFSLKYKGPWKNAVLMETPLLSMVKNEFCFRNQPKEGVWQENLAKKVDLLQKHPEIKFVEFGTRRRASKAIQEAVLLELWEKIPNQLLGTSNVEFAQQFNIQPYGTMAHQLYMVATALYQDPSLAQGVILSMWDQHWDGRMNFTLPDTYTTQFFLNNMSAWQVDKYSGFRQDSGDPFIVCLNIIDFWESKGIDPKSKTLMPSDGLDIPKMIELYDRFGDKTNMQFGLGTNLTDDCGNEPLSIVIKPVMANGSPCVKLSDNINKATGDALEIERIKKYLSDSESKNYENGGELVRY
jgi:nicotinate phosphoribosyltransferase